MRPETSSSRSERISRAEAARRAQAEQCNVDAWRILNGPADDAPAGLTLDRYGPWLVLAHRASVSPRDVEAWCHAAVEVLAPLGLVVKTLERRVAESESRVFFGELPEEPVRVREGDAVFLCDLNDGLQTGLFLDHRETRFLARKLARGVEVLNLFAYTCAFSVHAALGGAKRVTSVDVSKRALARGRENMRASGLSPDLHRWFADDVLEHLSRGAAEGYGLVIADPPVFGRARGRSFTLSRDLEALAAGAVRKVQPGGFLIFSTHATGLGDERLASALTEAAARQGRAAKVVERLGLPAWDHPVRGEAPPEAADRGDYLKTLVLRVG